VPGEPPVECAARELAEEIGQRAERWTELCAFLNSPGFTDERTICFLAEDLTRCERDAQGVEELHLSVERIDLEQLDELVATGEIADAKTMIGLYATRSHLAARAAGSAPPG
jgi:8-oxo-dGTP pyrophosphatase MutT (NUDIX family)